MILVTGGTGYIGSHTVVNLIAEGQQVVVIDNLVNSTIKVKDHIESITGSSLLFENVDLRNLKALEQVFQKYQIDAVIHFAAFKSVGESTRSPLSYYENNVVGMINLLKVCERAKVDRLIFSSSCTVYGQPEQIQIDESTPIMRAASPYGNTKIICEDIIRDFAVNNSLKTVLLRYFNPIGSHESFLLGDKQEGQPNNLIPYLTKVVDGELECLKVFGGDYNTSDGTAMRDYIHVTDLAEAHVKALEYSKEMASGEVDAINLGTGRGSTVLEVITAFERVTQLKVNYTITERRAGDVEAIYADPGKAKQILGWQASRTLEEMLSSAWQFQLQNGE